MSISAAATQADVLVAGAGAAGLSTALALSQAGFSVFCAGLVDTSANGRTVALFEASLRFYKALGVWRHFRGKTAPLDLSADCLHRSCLSRQAALECFDRVSHKVWSLHAGSASSVRRQAEPVEPCLADVTR